MARTRYRGVVNFILDKKYTGIKGSIEGGETTYGDDPYRKFSLTAGHDFFGGKLHVLLNGEYADRDGIYGVPRDWNNKGNYIITNPAYVAGNGLPQLVRVSNAGLSNATPGGIITNTALRGTYFGINGAPGTFAYGSQVLDPWMVGGAWQSVQVNNSQSLDADERRKSVFGRVDYAIDDDVNVYFESSWNKHDSLGWTGVQSNQGNVTIKSDNAYIPASVKTQLTTLNITQFTLGTTNADLPVRKTDNDRTVERYVVGADGGFSALGRDFKWDGYVQHGVTQTNEIARDITNNNKLALAQDAVFVTPGNVGGSGLAVGSIACRSTLTAPTNGCVPLDRLGIGVASPAALAYVLGNPYRRETFAENVGAANLRFDAFQGWAGPISLAMGVEHRDESVSGKVPLQYQSGWFVGNYLPNFGYYQVTEGYVETLIPVWEGLDVNAATRVTGYSTSGVVTTWKIGATWQPIDDFRFRVTESRDIRAPNLNELFAAGTSRSNILTDPFAGNPPPSTSFLEISTGNRNLKPEVARTFGIGGVFTPGFVPGLAFSIDYYNIEIKSAIASVDAQTIVNRCFQGQTVYCAAITRNAALTPPLQVNISPFNGSVNKAQGLDFEASYTTDLANIYDGLDGSFNFRAMATHYLENYTNNGIDAPFDTVGQNLGDGPPNWRYRFTATYNNDPWTVALTGRGISDGVYNNQFVLCTTGCPLSTTVHQTINDNHIDGAIYFDMTFTYAFEALWHRQRGVPQRAEYRQCRSRHRRLWPGRRGLWQSLHQPGGLRHSGPRVPHRPAVQLEVGHAMRTVFPKAVARRLAACAALAGLLAAHPALAQDRRRHPDPRRHRLYRRGDARLCRRCGDQRRQDRRGRPFARRHRETHHRCQGEDRRPRFHRPAHPSRSLHPLGGRPDAGQRALADAGRQHAVDRRGRRRHARYQGPGGELQSRGHRHQCVLLCRLRRRAPPDPA